MDLSSLKPSERIVDIKHPDGSERPLGITVSLVSLEDDRLKKIKRQINDERIRLERRGKGFDTEKVENNSHLLLFAAMTGWVWGKDESGEQNKFNGAVPEFNQANVLRVFTELPWFAAQIDEAVGETKAFFQA